MGRLVELSHGNLNPVPHIDEWIAAMVLESIGPIPHEVNVPFHDSQARKKAILIQTGWDMRWGTESYWETPPVLSESTLFRLVRSGVRLVGVDFWVSGRSTETQMILGGRLPIVENLRGLSSLPRWGLQVSVVAERAAADSSFPVRAFAEVT